MTLHVAYVVGQSTGGLPHYTAELANAVSKHADVTVLKPKETSADDLFADSVDVVDAFEAISVSMPKLYSFDVNPLDFVRGVRSYANLELLDELDPDVVHDTTDLFPQMKLYAGLQNIGRRWPFVVTRHEVPVSRFSLSRPPVLVEELLNAALPNVHESQYVVHSKRQKAALERQGVDADIIEVIPHGAYAVFGTHEDVEVENEPNSLLFFGNIVPPKGLDTLAEALPLVKREVPDVKLMVAGEGHLPRKLKRVRNAHPENVEVHNYYLPNAEVKHLFGRAGIVVAPYRSQGGTKGHSGAVSTAFSFGNPIVASTAGEFKEQVQETGAGLVVPPEDPERLAAAIVKILTDDELRESMRQNSLKMAQRLSWSSIAERHLELYERLAERTQTADSPVIEG
ncbi:glycosyltransferase family 4 protein [Haloprofundus halobius]|uniref:glycosyltransferase family 4 protein n=1 Tax=Haloprofundus halobius TaxID=2876194 RepID=UPI001CCFD6FC|nr:glycosyltransferase family 4 protein [Haloprofundus halobius]